MTDEGKKPTEKFVEAKGVTYPYAYDKGGKLARWFGVTGIPHAILVDPGGTILWRGHPAALGESQIEQAVQGAVTRPVWEWPSSAGGVKSAFVKRQYAKALASAEKLKDDELGLADMIRGIIARQAAAMTAAYEAGDYLKAVGLARECVERMKGLDEAKKAGEVLDRIKKDPQAQETLKGQKSLAKLQMEARTLRKKKDADKVVGSIEKLVERYPNTIVAAQGRELIDAIRKNRRSLR